MHVGRGVASSASSAGVRATKVTVAAAMAAATHGRPGRMLGMHTKNVLRIQLVQTKKRTANGDRNQVVRRVRRRRKAHELVLQHTRTVICHEAGDARAGERRVGAALDEAKQGLVLVAAEARHDKVKHLERIMRADGIGNAVRHRIHMRERRADAAVVRLVRQRLVRHGDLHEAEQAQMVQAVEVGEVLLAAIHIGNLGLDLEALVARQVEVPQLGIRIPVPVIVPVGDVVLECIVPGVDRPQLLQPAELRRQRQQLVPIQEEHVQVLQRLEVLGGERTQAIRREEQLPERTQREQRTRRHLVDLIHRQVEQLEARQVHQHGKHIVRQPVVRHAQVHERRSEGHRVGRAAVGHRERAEDVRACIQHAQTLAPPHTRRQRAQVVVTHIEALQRAQRADRVGQLRERICRTAQALELPERAERRERRKLVVVQHELPQLRHRAEEALVDRDEIGMRQVEACERRRHRRRQLGTCERIVREVKRLERLADVALDAGDVVVRREHILEPRERHHIAQHVKVRVPHIQHPQRHERLHLGRQAADAVAHEDEALKLREPVHVGRDNADRVERQIEIPQIRNRTHPRRKRVEPVVRQIQVLQRAHARHVRRRRREAVVRRADDPQLRQLVQRDVLQVHEPVRADVDLRELRNRHHALRHTLERERRQPQHPQRRAQLHKVDRQVRQRIHRQVQTHDPLCTPVHRYGYHREVHALQVHVLVRVVLVLEHPYAQGRRSVRSIHEPQQETQILAPQLIKAICIRIASLDQPPPEDPHRLFTRCERPIRPALIQKQTMAFRVGDARCVASQRIRNFRRRRLDRTRYNHVRVVLLVHPHERLARGRHRIHIRRAKHQWRGWIPCGQRQRRIPVHRHIPSDRIRTGSGSGSGTGTRTGTSVSAAHATASHTPT